MAIDQDVQDLLDIINETLTSIETRLVALEGGGTGGDGVATQMTATYPGGRKVTWTKATDTG